MHRAKGWEKSGVRGSRGWLRHDVFVRVRASVGLLCVVYTPSPGSIDYNPIGEEREVDFSSGNGEQLVQLDCQAFRVSELAGPRCFL